MPIVTAPKEILTTPCKELIGMEIPLAMYDTMKAVADEAGLVGLSANQVGAPYRFFIAKTTPIVDYILFVNPKIKGIKEKGRGFAWEGCASIPNTLCLVQRWNEVRIDYTDLNGEDVYMILKGLGARIVQHENDHLDGKLITGKARQTRKI